MITLDDIRTIKTRIGIAFIRMESGIDGFDGVNVIEPGRSLGYRTAIDDLMDILEVMTREG